MHWRYKAALECFARRHGAHSSIRFHNSSGVGEKTFLHAIEAGWIAPAATQTHHGVKWWQLDYEMTEAGRAALEKASPEEPA